MVRYIAAGAVSTQERQETCGQTVALVVVDLGASGIDLDLLPCVHRWRLAEANGTAYVDSVCAYCGEHREQPVTHWQERDGQWDRRSAVGAAWRARGSSRVANHCRDCRREVSKTATRCTTCDGLRRRKNRIHEVTA